MFSRYVKSYLIPDPANLGKRKTAVKKKTLNPTYNEILRVRKSLIESGSGPVVAILLVSSHMFYMLYI